MITMNPTIQSLVSQFERENDQLIDIIANLSDTQGKTLSGEGWPLLVVAHHVAVDHVILAEIARAIAQGESRPAITVAMLDQINAQHAQAHASCTKAETLELLRENGRITAAVIGEISDDQLDQSAVVFAGAPPMTVKQLIEAILIGHVAEHRASIQRVMS